VPERMDLSNLTPQEQARYDSLSDAVTELLNAEAETPELVLSVLMRVTGNAVGHFIGPEQLENAVDGMAEGIMEVAKQYQANVNQ